MASLRRMAPIFNVHELEAAMAHYRKLGFATRRAEGFPYAYATRDGLELHLGRVPRSNTSTGSAYIWVDDADELAAAWRTAGVDVHQPEDTPWGQHEGAVVDPDGNVIRFGSP